MLFVAELYIAVDAAVVLIEVPETFAWLVAVHLNSYAWNGGRAVRGPG